jgi:mannose-6-phosphate isomerase-like protein (cupin superfamily)
VLIRAKDAQVRTFGDVSVRNYVTREQSPDVSVAVATVNGEHPKTFSSHSTRVYYVTKGSGTVSVGEESYEVSEGDAVLIPPGDTHSIHGSITYVLVNAPAFDPAQEHDA